MNTSPLVAIEPGLYISSQIELHDIARLEQLGIRSIVCNRPDNEAAEQPDTSAIEAAAKARGLSFRAVAVRPGEFTEQAVAAFAYELEHGARPMLAYCRTGLRSASLWALARSSAQSEAEIHAAAARLGFNLDNLSPQLQARAKRASATANNRPQV